MKQVKKKIKKNIYKKKRSYLEMAQSESFSFHNLEYDIQNKANPSLKLDYKIEFV